LASNLTNTYIIEQLISGWLRLATRHAKNDNKLILSIGKQGNLPDHCELLEDHKYKSLHLRLDFLGFGLVGD
jgi:hypothetical protein